MKLIVLIFSISFLGFSFNSNAQDWVWAQRLGNSKSDKIISIKTDSSGYIYISGYFSNTTTIGTNAIQLTYTANASSKEAFIAKLDSTGFCYWARSGGEYFDDRVLGMDVDAAGNSVITGTFWQTSTGFNMGSVNVTGTGFGGGDQCFVVKHDANGNPLWGTFVASNTGDDQGLDLATDKSGNSYIVGFMTGNTLYCGGNAVTATNTNSGGKKHSYWLAKINSAGVFQWARCFGNLPYDTAANKYIERDIAVAVDDSGGVFVTGGYDHTWPFGNTSLTSTGGYDIFVLKYDSSGNFAWVTGGGSRKDDWSNGICTDKKGSVYIVGEHRDSLIIDNVIVKNYNKRDAFIVKLDANTGNAIWGKRAGTNLGGERGNDVVADTSCNIYIAGDIFEGAKFGDNIILPAGDSTQAFVAKISPEGKWQWATVGGAADDNDRGNTIAMGTGSQIYTAGFFRSSANYGSTTLASVGSSDGFFARLKDLTKDQGTGFEFEAPSDTILCKGDTIKLDLPDYAYLEFSPQNGVYLSNGGKKLIFTYDQTTTYTISGFDNGTCPAYDTISFTMVSAPIPIAAFEITPSQVPISNPTLTMNNKSYGATSFEWYYDGNLISTNTNNSSLFDSSGVYCFTLKATNPEGCVDTVSHCGEIYDLEKVFFPNAFTPNADGKNDAFGPVFINVNFDNMKDYVFKVFDRWGNIVFESDNPAFRWNGLDQNNKRPSAMGVYYYFCKFTTPRGEIYDKRGDVTLIR